MLGIGPICPATSKYEESFNASLTRVRILPIIKREVELCVGAYRR